MKTKTNKMLALALAVLFNCVTGSAFAAALGFSPNCWSLGYELRRHNGWR